MAGTTRAGRPEIDYGNFDGMVFDFGTSGLTGPDSTLNICASLHTVSTSHSYIVLPNEILRRGYTA